VTPAKPYHVGFSYFDQPFLWQQVAHELSEGAKACGALATIAGSRSVADQVQAIETLVESGANALAIAPVVPEIPALLPLLTKARSRGIVAVLLGLELHGAESLPIVRGDTSGGQAKIADHVFRHLDGAGEVAYIRALGDSVPNMRRVKAFYETLSRYPNIRLVRDIVRDWTPLEVKHGVAPMGGVWAEQIIRKHPRVRAILAPSDSVALGVVDYLERKKLADRILVTGFNASPAGLDAVQQGRLFATVALPARDIARHILQYAIALLKDKSVPSQTLLPVDIVTRGCIADIPTPTSKHP
jgi:ABC-type sugar transport system substrate-binding protein